MRNFYLYKLACKLAAYKGLNLILFFILIISFSNSGLAATYYSKTGTAPNLTASWNTNRDGTSGTAPANFTSGDIFVVQGSANAPGGTAHNITTTAIWSISGTNSKLWIEDGATLTASHLITLSSTTTWQIDANGTYVNNHSGDIWASTFAGIESFNASSTFEFKDLQTQYNAGTSMALEALMNVSSCNFGNIL